jgi:hypothetical protein
MLVLWLVGGPMCACRMLHGKGKVGREHVHVHVHGGLLLHAAITCRDARTAALACVSPTPSCCLPKALRLGMPLYPKLLRRLESVHMV